MTKKMGRPRVSDEPLEPITIRVSPETAKFIRANRNQARKILEDNMGKKLYYFKAEGQIVTKNEDGSYAFYGWAEEVTQAEYDEAAKNEVSRDEVESHEVQN